MARSGAHGLSYQWAGNARANRDFRSIVRQIAAEPTTTTACEVGGGARPALDRIFIEEHGLEYAVVDISARELAKAPDDFTKVVADISGVLPDHLRGFDLVFSKALAEHISDAEGFHRNVFAMLAQGGLAVHMYPTLFAPAFVVNLVLPAALSRWLLTKVQGARRDDEGLHGKFDAFYHWCRGPSRRQLRRLRGVGYEVVEYRAYFGTPKYYQALRLTWLDNAFSKLLLRFPVNALTSFAVVVLRRPLAQESDGDDMGQKEELREGVS